MALVVGGMVCIAAANAGATSQDLKTGYLVGATPRAQQISLFVGAIVSAAAIGWTVSILDTPSAAQAAAGITHAIGQKGLDAPQGTLMATLIKGILSLNLDWVYVLVGVFFSITMELCGVKALSFAVGLYLPLSTTLPIFAGGAVKGLADLVARRKGGAIEESDLSAGSLMATGLVAGGALAGVVVAILTVFAGEGMKRWSIEAPIRALLGHGGYALLGVAAFTGLAVLLFRAAQKPTPSV
jgi:putative OPT family oligopeptide transporter